MTTEMSLNGWNISSDGDMLVISRENRPGYFELGMDDSDAWCRIMPDVGNEPMDGAAIPLEELKNG